MLADLLWGIQNIVLLLLSIGFGIGILSIASYFCAKAARIGWRQGDRLFDNSFRDLNNSPQVKDKHDDDT